MTEDLSQYHHPLTELFSVGQKSCDRLSEEQIKFYETNGYLAGSRLLNDQQVAQLRNELDELIDPLHSGNRLFYEYHPNESTAQNQTLFHALGAWRISPAFHDLLWNASFVTAAGQLLGGAVRFWHDQIFYKPSRHGGVVAWHQDYSYWTRTKPMAHLSCWIGLDESTVQNGCVHYVPGSHRWPLLPITGLANEMDAIQTVLTDEQKSEFKPVPIELKCGEASFHHPLTVHGSYENKTERPRRGVVLNVFRDGVRSDSNELLLEGVPAIPKGEKIQGRFFPLLTAE